MGYYGSSITQLPNHAISQWFYWAASSESATRFNAACIRSSSRCAASFHASNWSGVRGNCCAAHRSQRRPFSLIRNTATPPTPTNAAGMYHLPLMEPLSSGSPTNPPLVRRGVLPPVLTTLRAFWCSHFCTLVVNWKLQRARKVLMSSTTKDLPIREACFCVTALCLSFHRCVRNSIEVSL